MNYYNLCDSESSYGIIATKLSEKEFVKILNYYRNKNEEDYSDMGFYDYLNSKGIDYEVIDPIDVGF